MLASRYGDASNQLLGCCESGKFIAGTTFEAECKKFVPRKRNFIEGMKCSDREQVEIMIPHDIRPCCHGTFGSCNMTTKEHCSSLRGKFHSGKGAPEHCSQASSLCRSIIVLQLRFKPT